MSNIPEAVCVANWARQSQQGDLTNVDLLAAHLRSVLVKRFVQLGVGAEQAQELAQDCIIDVLRNIEKYDESKAAIGTWVSGFARTAVRTWRRREFARNNSEIGVEVMPETGVEDAGIVELEDTISTTIRRLNVLDQELLNLRFNQGLDFDAIAKMTDMTPVNCRKRISRCVDRLRRNPELRLAIGLAE